MECSNVEVGMGVTLTQSPFWTLHIYGSANVVVAGLHVQNDLTAPNTDGMDLDSSENVLVTNCTINTADDHVAVKSGNGAPGRAYGRPSRDIVIENNILGPGAGLAIGSETAGSVMNVTIRRNTFGIGAAKYAEILRCD